MELINKYQLSLGLETYDVLGFDSEDQLNYEIQKLIQPRPGYDKDLPINDLTRKIERTN